MRLPKLLLILLASLPSFFIEGAQAESRHREGLAQLPPQQEQPAAQPANKSQQLTNLSQRTIEATQKSIELNGALTDHINGLLKAAETYDITTYRKLDDELGEIYEQLDANYLEWCMFMEAAQDAFQDHDQNWQKSQSALIKMKEVAPQSIRRSRAFSNKSSAIFYLCFGLPVQASHYARLSLNLAEAGGDAEDKTALADIRFYLADAALWCADYKGAEEQFKQALLLNPAHRYASYFLADTYLAEHDTGKAIEVLTAARERSSDDEMRANIDRSLALAYTLSGLRLLAKQSIASAKSELSNQSKQEFPGIAQESAGVVSTLSGDFEKANIQLSQALTTLQLSPLKLGNRLEAAQTALWRSYCKVKLGDKVGAAEDRRYALSFSDEAAHLPALAQTLDPLFGYKETRPPIGQIRDRWAVVVGIGNFADPRVPTLRYPAKDANDVRQFLIQTAGFKPDHVKLLTNSEATRANICDSVAGGWLPKMVKPGDLVFFFVSSHGTPNYKQIGALNALVTYDTKIDHLFSTSLPMQSIVRMIRSKLKQQHSFIVLDTCYSGGLDAPGEEAKIISNSDPELLVISRHQLLVSSSDRKERSWESKRYENSVFTRQLIDAVAANPAYQDFHSIFAQIAEKVTQEVSRDFKNPQTPRLAGLWTGKGLVRPVAPAVAGRR